MRVSSKPPALRWQRHPCSMRRHFASQATTWWIICCIFGHFTSIALKELSWNLRLNTCTINRITRIQYKVVDEALPCLRASQVYSNPIHLFSLENTLPKLHTRMHSSLPATSLPSDTTKSKRGQVSRAGLQTHQTIGALPKGKKC